MENQKAKIKRQKSKILFLVFSLCGLCALCGLVFAQTATRNADQVLNAAYDSVRTMLETELPAGTNTDLSAVAATGTQTSTAYAAAGNFKQAELYITWSGITGSPAGCTIQVKASGDGATFINSGTAVSVTPGTNAVSVFTGALGTAVQYTYACTTYPTGGTLTLKTVYKQ